MGVRLSFTSVKDEASFFDFNGGNFACVWQKVSSIEGKEKAD
jgi:hypothetical protein